MTSSATEEKPRVSLLAPFARLLSAQGGRLLGFMRHSGAAGLLAWRALVALFTTRIEPRAFI
jgi:hypothetical protein